MKTIKELKEAIKDLPDDMLIGGSGWFGEYLECESFGVITVDKYHYIHDKEEKIEIFCITNDYPGEEPD